MKRLMLALGGIACALAACAEEPAPHKPMDAAMEASVEDDANPSDLSLSEPDLSEPDLPEPDLPEPDLPEPDGGTASDRAAPTSDFIPSSCDVMGLIDRTGVPGTPPCAAHETLCGAECHDLTTSRSACGGCGRRCGYGLQCIGGACVCPPGLSLCGLLCVDTLRSYDHCGACGRRCPAGEVCFDGACGCPALRTRCGDTCVSLRSTDEHCGACGRVCPSAPHAFGRCLRGACARPCEPPYGDCDGAAANGCERDLANDPENCGACGHRCAIAGAETACRLGECFVTRCAAGTADCDRDPANGCEERLDASTFHCGACDRPCRPGARCVGGTCVCPEGVATCASPAPRPPCAGSTAGCSVRVSSNPVCTLGTCGVRCVPYYGNPQGNCDGNDVNGCETLLSTSAHCGRCGNTCARGQSCVAGACMCPPGSTLCGARCADTTADGAHCGACGRACGAGEECVDGACAVATGARPIAPLSTARVTSRRPTLRWRLGRGRDGARLTLCADRACARVLSARVVAGETAAPEVDLPPGVAFWRVEGRRAGGEFDAPSATWEFVVGPRATPVDASYGAFEDFNGDGRADFAQHRSELGVWFDTVYVYHGASTGLVDAPVARLSGPEGDVRLDPGTRVATADFNGDGYTDLAMLGAEHDTYYEEGPWPLLLYRGGPGGIDGAPQRIQLPLLRRSGAIEVTAPIGDVNRDGYADLAISIGNVQVIVLRGGPLGPRWPPMAVMTPQNGLGGRFGYAIRGVGDVNRDGFADFAVGEPDAFGALGVVHLFFGGIDGPASVADLTVTTPAPEKRNFGRELGDPGDIDGDGFTELMVRGPTALWIYRGTPSGIGPSEYQPPLVASPPAWALGVGDVNGDGFGDLAHATFAGMWGGTNQCIVTFGSARGAPARPPQELASPLPFDRDFGATLLFPGDFNGDGFDDVIVWSDKHASVFLGSPCGVLPRPARILDAAP